MNQKTYNRTNNRWLLPDGIDEVLPPDALALELIRQRILSLYNSWGYDLVMPAMIEFTDSLLTGTANSLDRKTFTLVDQLSGKQMGLRSDMTPQVARIDAHLLASSGTSRLCYCGHLVHAQSAGLNPARSPLQIGAEIFGNASIDADIEVACLMLETLQRIPLNNVSIDLGHVGIFRSLFAQSGLARTLENTLFDMLQRKSIPELKDFLRQQAISERLQQQFYRLAQLNGGVETIAEARSAYQDIGGECQAALDHIEAVASGIQLRYPSVQIHFDLSELRGYEYHTGLVFAAFLPGQGEEIARGGRYDDIGLAFGVARPATGFSADLYNLYQLAGIQAEAVPTVLAPNSADEGLLVLINQLREKGGRVIIDLSNGDQSPQQQNCNQQIIHDGKQWVVNQLSER